MPTGLLTLPNSTAVQPFRGNAPKTKSTTAQEELLDWIALMDRQGHSQHQIAAKVLSRFGYTLTQGAISQKLKTIKQRYRNATVVERRQSVNEQLEAMRDVRREAWQAYYDSMLDEQKSTEQYGRVEAEAAGGGLESSEELLKRIEVREGRLPDNAYLATVMATHKAERELLGLDEEVHRNLMAVNDVELVLRAVLEAQREVLADRPDLLRMCQQRCMAKIPWDVVRGRVTPVEANNGHVVPVGTADGRLSVNGVLVAVEAADVQIEIDGQHGDAADD